MREDSPQADSPRRSPDQGDACRASGGRPGFLSIILTINAVLVACLIWTQVADRGSFASEAHAQAGDRDGSVPNAAAQRLEMIQSLRAIQKSLEATNRQLSTGRMRVEVTNIQEIEARISGD
ncbi:MAG: hypothetical protein KF817_11245 [Phycisphaeraceae bacterium]|nr:hypothetical protein [Phycisphaeraceae bacterium]